MCPFAWIRMRKHAAVLFFGGGAQIQQFYFRTHIYSSSSTETVFVSVEHTYIAVLVQRLYLGGTQIHSSTFCVSVLELLYMCVCSQFSLGSDLTWISSVVLGGLLLLLYYCFFATALLLLSSCFTAALPLLYCCFRWRWAAFFAA